MEILGKLLGSGARVRIMRLFLLNKSKAFKNKDIWQRSRLSPAIVRREIRLLSLISFIKKRGQDWIFNPVFKYAPEVESLLVNSNTLNTEAIFQSFKKTGRLKLLLISGVFIKAKDSRVDLLVVGDRMRRGKIDEEVRKLEAEIGRELIYAVFETKEFSYRLSMYDKLVRDILDFPHQIIFQDRKVLGELSTQVLKKS